MKEGDVFRLRGGDNPYRTEAQAGRRCDGCAGRGKLSLCKKLPYCSKESGYVIFRKLSAGEARRVIANGTEILTY
jgi:hypothetical protein